MAKKTVVEEVVEVVDLDTETAREIQAVEEIFEIPFEVPEPDPKLKPVADPAAPEDKPKKKRTLGDLMVGRPAFGRGALSAKGRKRGNMSGLTLNGYWHLLFERNEKAAPKLRDAELVAAVKKEFHPHVSRCHEQCREARRRYNLGMFGPVKVKSTAHPDDVKIKRPHTKANAKKQAAAVVVPAPKATPAHKPKTKTSTKAPAKAVVELNAKPVPKATPKATPKTTPKKGKAKAKATAKAVKGKKR